MKERDLPHRLREFCLTELEKLEQERKELGLGLLSRQRVGSTTSPDVCDVPCVLHADPRSSRSGASTQVGALGT